MSENVAGKVYGLTVLTDKDVGFVDVDHDAEMVYCSLDMESTVLALMHGREGIKRLGEFLKINSNGNWFENCTFTNTGELWVACRFEERSASNVGLSILGVFNDDGKPDSVCRRRTDFVIGPLTLNKASLYSFVGVRFPLTESVEGQDDHDQS